MTPLYSQPPRARKVGGVKIDADVDILMKGFERRDVFLKIPSKEKQEIYIQQFGRVNRSSPVKVGRILNLRLGQLWRFNGCWYASRHTTYLQRPLCFDDLGSALRFLGYNEVRHGR